MFWNYWIRLIFEAYLEIAILVTLQFLQPSFNSWGTMFSLFNAAVFGAGALIELFLIYYYYKKRDSFRDENFQETCGTLVADLYTKDSVKSLIYLGAYMGRRLIMTAVAFAVPYGVALIATAHVLANRND